MNNEKILKEILIELFHIKKELLNPENYSEPLTGRVFKFNHRDLVYLFFELEKRCKTKFNIDNLQKYRFNNINGILSYLQNIEI